MPRQDARTPGPDAGDDRIFALIAEGLTQLVGFGGAVINIVRGDELEVVAVAGVDRVTTYTGRVVTAEELVGARWPLTYLEEALAVAEDWGAFRFVPHTAEAGRRAGWVRTDAAPVADGPDAWHPADLLIAPVRDSTGLLCGALTLDAPLGGRRPDEARRRLMEKYAAQAERAIATALERERLAAQARLLDTARVVVGRASRGRSLAAVVRETGETLRAAFGASALWTRIFATDGGDAELVQYFADGDLPRDRRMAEIGERAARALWERGAASVVELCSPVNDVLSSAEVAYVHDFLRREGYSALLCTPLGAGRECLGSLVILRPLGAPPYRRLEIESAHDIGYDLGRLLLAARTFQEEQQLIARLRELDAYKSQLVARMADELAAPLETIVRCVEELRTAPPPADGLVAELWSRTEAMAHLVDDLLLLARVSDRPDDAEPVDLAAIVSRAVAHPRATVLHVDADTRVAGDAAALEWLVTRMAKTAVIHSHGGTALIELRRSGDDVALTVTTEDGDLPDLRRLLRHYFGSSDPRVLDRPGSGLAMTLVVAIVRRHGGRIALADGPGAGLRVTLPSAR